MAYTEEQLRKLFQSPFNKDSWSDFVINFFRARTISRNPEELDINPDEGYGYYWGNLSTNDTYEISFFYLKMNASIDRRKVGLRQLIEKYIKIDSDAGIAVFDDGNHWRLSFITDMRGEETSPKRFTFVFGDPENQYLTPVSRFLKLQKDGINYAHIRDAFSVEALTTQFYNDLYNWYLWALDPSSGVYFPNKPNTIDDDYDQLDTKIIRLITRLMFVWFIKQKDLVPDDLFNPERLEHILLDFDPQSMVSSNYYQAILQNLFFATLNRPIKTITYDKDGNEQIERRCFAKMKDKPDVKSKYRYEDLFKISEDKILSLFEFIPFINGGLFECLDKNKTSDGVDQAYYHDGFSRNNTIVAGHYTRRAFIPNKLFFDPEDGIISIFRRYNFTVEENSPSEQQIALDPELLGKVFENLLGVYNPETKETARNQSGSFYTPREIVNYMVDISLQAYLGDTDEVKQLFKDDFEYDESKKAFYDNVITKLKTIKVLDPACGSGAFPIGMLNCIVEILQNLHAEGSKYDLKLAIMENCIFGGDIQTIAAQITKLRFFISLVCDCDKNDNADDNFGIPNLPNLETHFVTADSLIALKRPKQYSLFEQDVLELQEKLRKVRHEHFMAKTVYQKTKLRNLDKQLREELIELLKSDDVFASDDAVQMAQWNPYDQNGRAPFFDPKWMFDIENGFDIVIGNPPYLRIQGIRKADNDYADFLSKTYKAATGSFDLYMCFVERSLQLIKHDGLVNFIMPVKWTNAAAGKGLRKLFSEGKLANRIINFGAYQVFNASTYTGLQWFVPNSEMLMYNELDRDLPTNQELKVYLDNLTIEDYSRIKYDRLTEDTWVLTSSKIGALLDKLDKQPRRVGTVFERIFQGLATGKDDVFFLHRASKRENVVKAYSNQLKREVVIESNFVRPLLKGEDVHRYDYIKSHRVTLFPYKIESGKAVLYSETELKSFFPLGYSYLKECEQLLRNREKGRFNIDDEWFQFSRKQGLIGVEQAKLVAPEISLGGNYAYDERGEFYSTTKIYGYIKKVGIRASYKSLMAILNSKVMWFFMCNTGYVLRGGYYTFKTNYVSPFPIPSDEAILTVEPQLESLVDKVTEAKAQHQEKEMKFYETQIDEIIFDLYGLTREERDIIGYIDYQSNGDDEIEDEE